MKSDYELNKVYEFEMAFMLERSNLPLRQYSQPTLYPSNEDVEAFTLLNTVKQNIVSYVNQGRSLYIYSAKVGNGKTTWATKILLEYFHLMAMGNQFKPRGLFINVSWFLNKMKEVISKPDHDFNILCSLIVDVDIVVWDDISSNVLSDYDHTKLFGYIDRRILQGSTNIFTGNHDGNGLAKVIGNRLASRVWNGSDLVQIVGGDRRGVVVKDD